MERSVELALLRRYADLVLDMAEAVLSDPGTEPERALTAIQVQESVVALVARIESEEEQG